MAEIAFDDQGGYFAPSAPPRSAYAENVAWSNLQAGDITVQEAIQVQPSIAFPGGLILRPITNQDNPSLPFVPVDYEPPPTQLEQAAYETFGPEAGLTIPTGPPISPLVPGVPGTVSNLSPELLLLLLILLIYFGGLR